VAFTAYFLIAYREVNMENLRLEALARRNEQKKEMKEKEKAEEKEKEIEKGMGL
jgi:hypothetical protein